MNHLMSFNVGSHFQATMDQHQFDKLRMGFLEMYLNDISDHSKLLLDEIVRTVIPEWIVGADIHVNMPFFTYDRSQYINLIIPRIRMVFILILSKKIPVAFAEVCDWDATWPAILALSRKRSHVISTDCPISGEAIQWPAKFRHCKHIECFDYNISEMLTSCPFCGKPAGEVVLDKTLKVVLDSLPVETRAITLWDDFSNTGHADLPSEPLAFYKDICSMDIFLTDRFIDARALPA